jgi:hypothetical protein
MPGDLRPRRAPGQPTAYQIRVEGHLDDRWAEWPEGLSVAREETGDTVLTVPSVDQAALLGLLRKLRDVGARLVSINPVVPGRSDTRPREVHR